MADKKIGPVEESIRRLREQRYLTRGAGAKSKAIAAHASVDQLRAAVAAVPPTKSRAQKKAAKKKAKRR
jgi:hypothetical protein